MTPFSHRLVLGISFFCGKYREWLSHIKWYSVIFDRESPIWYMELSDFQLPMYPFVLFNFVFVEPSFIE